MRLNRKAMTSIVMFIGLGTMLAACSSGPGSKAASPPSHSKLSVKTHQTSTSTTIISKYVNTVSLRPQVTTTSCKAIDGGWKAAGTIDNSGKVSRQYHVTVYFTDSKATVLGSGSSTSLVSARQHGTWEVASNFPAEGKMNCVLVGVG